MVVLSPTDGGAGTRVRECVTSGQCEPLPDLWPAVAIRQFVSQACGAKALSTGTATFAPCAELPYHVHGCSEAMTVLSGSGVFEVQGRSYRLGRLDSIHFPTDIPHRVVNSSRHEPLLIHWAAATAAPAPEFVLDRFAVRNRNLGKPQPGDPEHIARFSEASMYKLASGTRFYDLFAGRFGAVGICGGYAEFDPGSSLPCHMHQFDESITIVAGEAACEVFGKRYRLSDCDTAFVPQGRPHRFLNQSQAMMAMIWVYAGSEPERTIVRTGYCDGTLRNFSGRTKSLMT